MAKTIYPKSEKRICFWKEPTTAEIVNGRRYDCERQLYQFSNGDGIITTEELFDLEQRQVRFDLDWLKRMKSGVKKVTAYYLTILSQFKK